ncbi:hypothetical protein, partial [Candidatus Endomicrobiellum trichonymphae]|uniref:hypothetical protein n=1 Tax=Endomicrobium trichonymphae TaxID=1408204 RepID=UPI0039B8F0A1
PLLKNILAAFTEDKSILFPHIKSKETEKSENSKIDGNKDIKIALFIAQILGEKDFWTADDIIKKSVYCKTNKILSIDDAAMIVAALEKLDILKEKCCLDDSMPLLEELSNLDTVSRLIYITSGIYFHLTEKENKHIAVEKYKIAIVSTLIILLIETGTSIADAFFLHGTIKRFLKTLLKNEYFIQKTKNTELTVIEIDSLITALEKTGLLIKSKTGKGQYCFYKNLTESTNIKKSPHIVFDSSFSFFPMPEISFKEILYLSKFAEIKIPDAESRTRNTPRAEGNFVITETCSPGLIPPVKPQNLARETPSVQKVLNPTARIKELGSKLFFVMTRESVTNAMNKGITSSSISAILQELSLGRTNGNIDITLKDW